jgi:hypothetical protein
METRIFKLISLILLISTRGIWAQNPNDTLLLGSWKLNSPTTVKSNQVYSFYKNGIYQRKSNFHYSDTIPFISFDTSVVEIGIWKVGKKNALYLEKRHTLPETYGLLWYDLKYYFLRRDSKLIFSDRHDFSEKNKSLNQFTLTAPESQLEFSDNYDCKQFDKHCLYLVNSLTPTIRIKLDNVFAPELSFIENSPNSSIKTRTTTLTGLLSYSTDSTVKCNLEKQRVVTVFQDWSLNIKDTSIISSELALGTIRIKDINSIEYNTIKRNRWHNIGFLTGFASCLTLIASPLISIDYKEGKFNTNKFLTYAGSGLVGLSIGITIWQLNNPKIYKLGSRKQADKNSWYLDKRIE